VLNFDVCVTGKCANWLGHSKSPQKLSFPFDTNLKLLSLKHISIVGRFKV